jgi:hypothetical protein
MNSTASRLFGFDIPVFSGDVLLDTWEPQVLVSRDNVVTVFALNQGGVRACLECGADPIIYRQTSGKIRNAPNLLLLLLL